MELHFHMTTKGFTPSVLLSLLTSMGWLSANSSAPDATATVFNNLKLNDVIESPNIGFPDAAPFPYDNRDIPIFFIGDDVLLVGTRLTKPFLRKNLTKEERIKQDVLYKMLLEYAPTDGTVF